MRTRIYVDSVQFIKTHRATGKYGDHTGGRKGKARRSTISHLSGSSGDYCVVCFRQGVKTGLGKFILIWTLFQLSNPEGVGTVPHLAI